MRLSQIAVLVTTAVCATYGCQRGPDTKGNVRKALDQANMPAVDVKVDTDEHIVHLKGIVGSLAERSRAQEVADAVVGTSGRVLNELTVKGVNDTTAGDLDGDIRKNLDKMIDREEPRRRHDEGRGRRQGCRQRVADRFDRSLTDGRAAARQSEADATGKRQQADEADHGQ